MNAYDFDETFFIRTVRCFLRFGAQNGKSLITGENTDEKTRKLQ